MINSFTGEYAFLSNFYPSPVVYDGVVYQTVEHAYQAAKTENLDERANIKAAESPGLAKKRGRRVTMRPDWETYKLYVMEYLVAQKFYDGELRDMLIATEGQEIVEGNWWGDQYWGVCKGKGSNHLGKILMSVRSGIFMGIY